MSHVIYLVRHAIAGPATDGMSDADRALTADGHRKMQRAAAGLKYLDVKPDVVLSSPLRRAQETAAIVASELMSESSVEIYPPLAPGHRIEDVYKGLRPYRSAREVVLVGHEPDMGGLASHLLTGTDTLVTVPFKKGAVAAIQVESVPPRSAGVLLWFMTPKQLRSVGGRDD